MTGIARRGLKVILAPRLVRSAPLGLGLPTVRTMDPAGVSDVTPKVLNELRARPTRPDACFALVVEIDAGEVEVELIAEVRAAGAAMTGIEV